MAQLPSRLQDTATIGVYSPSGAFSDSPEKTRLFDAGVARLQGHGFDVRESRHCRSAWFHMSAPARERVSDLHLLTQDPDVDVILPSIGGHVAAQMLPLIDFDLIASSGKALFGFSDNSILPLVTTAQTGAVTFHSLCDVTYGFGRFSEPGYEMTESNFLSAVRASRIDLEGTKGWRPLQDGTANGALLGGNLRAMLSLAGTPWWPDWTGKIMFWETGDSLHAVAQELTHLANTGAFDNLAGMIIGRVAGLREDFYRPDQVAPIRTVLLDILGLEGRFPIVTEADIGHDAENVTIPLGAIATLDVHDEKVSCTVVD